MPFLHAVTDTESNFAGRSFHWSFEASENNAVAANTVETIQQIDKAKLEETCVVVNEQEFPIFPQREDKRRTYKVLSYSLCTYIYLLACMCVCILWLRLLLNLMFSEEDSGSLFFKNEVCEEAGVRAACITVWGEFKT